MKKMFVIISITMATVILVAYQNCSKVKFADPVTEEEVENGSPSGPSDPIDPPSNPIDPIDPIVDLPIDPIIPIDPPTDPIDPIDDVPDFNPSCTTSVLKELEVAKSFAATSGCAWGVNGNLAKPTVSSNVLRARTEQTLSLGEIPANANICKMEFVFPEQPFLYDDHIFLALNERILTTSNSESLDFLDSDALGNKIYDWLKLRGQPQPQVMTTNTYCNGVDSVCSLPQTSPTQDYLGIITMNIHKSTIQKIMESTTQATPTIKLITTGDDDTLDCRHFKLDFNVKVSYY